MTTLNLRVDPNSLEAVNLGKHTEDMVRILLDGWYHELVKPRYRRGPGDESVIKISVDLMPRGKS